MLGQEKFDIYQSWQAKPFIEKITGAIPATGHFETFDDALAFVRGDFETAVRSLSTIVDTDAEPTRQPVLLSMADVEAKEIAWLPLVEIAHVGLVHQLHAETGSFKFVIVQCLHKHRTIGCMSQGF